MRAMAGREEGEGVGEQSEAMSMVRRQQANLGSGPETARGRNFVISHCFLQHAEKTWIPEDWCEKWSNAELRSVRAPSRWRTTTNNRANLTCLYLRLKMPDMV